MKEKLAKVIRVITVPPVLATVMLVLLYNFYGNSFASLTEMMLGIVCLGIVPVCAYPMASLNKDTTGNRDKQRKMAFILNFVGYFIAVIVGSVMKYSKMLLSIFWAYFVAVFILTIINKKTRLKASGHAASCVFPYIVLSYWIGGWVLPICIFLYAIEFWASVELKRHTIQEFLLGSLVGTLAFVCVWGVFRLY